MHSSLLMVLLGALAIIGSACDEDRLPPLVIGGIPDQSISRLEERFGGVAKYLEGELAVDVRYRPSISYVALVTAFENGDIGLGWFGGLTGVQARNVARGSAAIAQRPRDQEFRSVFIVSPDLSAVQSLQDLRGRSFTFGSESSTSGHLMPRFYLREAGIDPESDFKGRPSYSGSHDKTWYAVESGAFDAGALNEAVWQRAVETRQADTSKVRVLAITAPYFDYHWVAHSSLDDTYGDGFTARLTSALLKMGRAGEPRERILELFDTDGFIATTDDNYRAIEEIARSLGMVGD